MNLQLKLGVLLIALVVTGVACGADIPSLVAGFAPVEPTTLAPPATPLPKKFPVGPKSLDAGLEQADSYRQSVVVDFEGTRAGQPAAGHIETLAEINRLLPAQHHYQLVEADIPGWQYDTGVSHLFLFDDRIYVTRQGETFWFDAPPNQSPSPGEMGFFELKQLVTLPKTVSRPPQFETINGQKLQKFSFTQNDLINTTLTFSQAEGALWVSPTSNQIVQLVISASITSAPALPNAHLLDEGSLNLRYTLSDINANIPIEYPANTQVDTLLLSALPRPDDAHITAILPTLLEYTSAISPVSATLFYQTALTNTGWIEEGVTVFNEKARLSYAQTGKNLNIIINPAAEAGRISVLLTVQTSP